MTTENADQVSDFYAAVAGWKREAVSMGEYSDYNMTAPDGSPAAGICHKKGVNSDIPGGWMIYIVVADLDASLAECEARGGRIVRPAQAMGPMGRYAAIQDPGGSHCMLFQAPPATPAE